MATIPAAPSPIQGDVIPVSASLATDVLVNLQVGERRFTTMRDTLTSESTFFASLLSYHWENILPDGSYFVDADPTLFEHVLGYLRRGIPPLFFDRARGHDHAMYLPLLKEARYFGISHLEEWLVNKRYLDVVDIKRTVEMCDAELSISSIAQRDETSPSDVSVQYQLVWGTRQVHVCPRATRVHRGQPEACGKECHHAKMIAGYQFDMESYPRMVKITEELIVKPDICLAGD